MTANEQIIEIIKTGLNDQLEFVLFNNPSLAEGATEEGISPLLLAAYYRNSKAVERIKKFKQHFDLYEAVSTGEITIANKIILEHPDLVNKPSIDGFSPLGLSCFFGHYEIAKYMIENGAHVNLASDNSFKVAPIHSACAISDYALPNFFYKMEQIRMQYNRQEFHRFMKPHIMEIQH